MTIHLGPNQYGKAEVRIVKLTRDTPRHVIEDLNVTSQLRGDFTRDSHLHGDNALVVATDTQKNTIYGLAREHGIGSPEAFLLRLGEHFTSSFDWVTGGRWSAEAYGWDRIAAGGAPHDHAFVRSGQETRTAFAERDGAAVTVGAGLTDLTVLKSTGSEFHGFPQDRFTTLQGTDDRILATAVTAEWTYAQPDVDFNATYAGVRALLLETFAVTHSRLSMPNKHHFLVDLEPFGLDNPGEVFFAADRPYGLIEATVLR